MNKTFQLNHKIVTVAKHLREFAKKKMHRSDRRKARAGFRQLLTTNREEDECP